MSGIYTVSLVAIGLYLGGSVPVSAKRRCVPPKLRFSDVQQLADALAGHPDFFCQLGLRHSWFAAFLQQDAEFLIGPLLMLVCMVLRSFTNARLCPSK